MDVRDDDRDISAYFLGPTDERISICLLVFVTADIFAVLREYI